MIESVEIIKNLKYMSSGTFFTKKKTHWSWLDIIKFIKNLWNYNHIIFINKYKYILKCHFQKLISDFYPFAEEFSQAGDRLPGLPNGPGVGIPRFGSRLGPPRRPRTAARLLDCFAGCRIRIHQYLAKRKVLIFTEILRNSNLCTY